MGIETIDLEVLAKVINKKLAKMYKDIDYGYKYHEVIKIIYKRMFSKSYKRRGFPWPRFKSQKEMGGKEEAECIKCFDLLMGLGVINLKRPSE